MNSFHVLPMKSSHHPRLSLMLLISWKMIQAKIILPMTVAACCSLKCSFFFMFCCQMAMLQPLQPFLVSQSGQKQRCLDQIALKTLFVASILVEANLFNTWEDQPNHRTHRTPMMRLLGSTQSQDLSLEPVDRF